MRKCAALLALILCASAQAWDSPRQAIDMFLKFELAGGRLQSWQFNKYLAVPKGYDEPGWDQVHLVESAKVLSTKCNTSRCVAKVQFIYVPTSRMNLMQVFPHHDGGSEVLDYVIVEHGGQWLLEGDNGAPRVTQADFKRLWPKAV